MTHKEYRTLLELDKKDWIETLESGETNWDAEKVKHFWSVVSKNAPKNGNYFFFDSFFPIGAETIAQLTRKFIGTKNTRDLIFVDCKFQGKIGFIDFNVSNKLSFVNCFFQDNLIFNNLTIGVELTFLGCEFNGSVEFERLASTELTFNSCCFHENLFITSIIVDDFKLLNSSIKYIFRVTGNIFTDRFLLKYINQKAFLDDVFPGYVHPPVLTFSGNTIPENNKVFRINMRETRFSDVNLAKMNFELCDWSFKGARLMLAGDSHNLEVSELNYRMLKKNFDFNKDWELSGSAFISEMEMRKLRLFEQRKLYHWFVYWFYGFFGGYTQNLARPIISIIGLTLICSIAYFFIDNNLINAIERGLKGSLPYIKIHQENPYPGYWLLLKNIQLVLGGTFLAFFILALRKRFKQ
ncbi:MAG: hypothetical protein Aureis2KO_17370 [Aureisphaera sp.]